MHVEDWIEHLAEHHCALQRIERLLERQIEILEAILASMPPVTPYTYGPTTDINLTHKL